MADGTVDSAFNPGTGANGAVYALATQADGTALIGGAFTAVAGAGRNHLARLNTDGTIDSTFNLTPPDGIVRDIAIQSDGGIIIGGEFTHVGGAASGRLARLNSDGTLDSSLATGTGANGVVFAVAVTADGRIGLGGDFTVFNGQPLNGIARLNFDGSVDAGFNPGTGANNTVLALRFQPDSAMVIGGKFTVVDDLPRNHIGRVHGDEKFSLGILQFSAAIYLVGENGASVSVILRRSGNPKGACSVDYATSDGTATAGADYQPASGTLDFAPGEIEKRINISILDDTEAEGNESFNLTLTNPVGVELTDQAATRVVIGAHIKF
jgi:uncharacterized delta-60 repeat protein